MPYFYPTLSANLREWAIAQPLFFTASAPLQGRHINLSPKGYPGRTLAFFPTANNADKCNLVAYLDYTGSGVETISHIRENGRVTMMFCSFTAKPRIMRLFCTGEVVETGEPGFEEWRAKICAEFPEPLKRGVRAVIILKIFKVQTSCGFAVPLLLNHAEDGNQWEERPTLERAMGKFGKVEGGYEKYWASSNARSLDGVLGLRFARKEKGERVGLDEVHARLKQYIWHPLAIFLGVLLGITLTMLFGTLRDVDWTTFRPLVSNMLLSARTLSPTQLD